MLRRLIGGSGSAKMQSGYALGAFLLHHIFAVAETALQFLYRNRKNVIYSRDVMRKFTRLVDKIKEIYKNKIGAKYCILLF
jgi:hypothetical protein